MSSKLLPSRCVVSLFLFMGVAILPWYILFLFVGLAVLAFDYFIEGLIIAFVFELLYARVNAPFWTLYLFPASLGIFLVWELFLRSRLRFTLDV